MKYDQTHTIGQSTVHIIGPKNIEKEQIDAIINECHSIIGEIIREITGDSKRKLDGSS